jgi:hypothetical protein
VTWNTPSSSTPVLGYEVTLEGLREGDGFSLTALDDRRVDVEDIFGGRPTLMTIRAITGDGMGAPAIVPINPAGSAPAPTVQVSNIGTDSFDLTLTAPNGWEGGLWGVRVFETEGVDSFSVAGYGDGPAPAVLTVTVDGLQRDTDYTIVAAVDVEGASYQLSSWSVTNTSTRGLFSDVPRGVPFASEINWLADSGVTRGFPDGTYRPSGTVNRDAMSAFLYRFAGKPAFTPPAVSPFSDVTPSTPFYREITWLASTGITGGFSDGTFRPLGTVNRDAMAAFLYRFAGKPAFTPPAVSPFSDVTPSTPFYREITWLASTGITGGFSDGTFRPLQSVKRDAMAAFLYRFEGLSGG